MRSCWYVWLYVVSWLEADWWRLWSSRRFYTGRNVQHAFPFSDSILVLCLYLQRLQFTILSFISTPLLFVLSCFFFTWYTELVMYVITCVLFRFSCILISFWVREFVVRVRLRYSVADTTFFLYFYYFCVRDI